MRRPIVSLIAVTIFAICVPLLRAQTAQLQGRVADSSGAVIPNAHVRVVDQSTNVAQKTQTNSAGEYAVIGLNPSVYKVFIDAAGFKNTASTAITLNVDQKATLDFALQPGGASETVTVSGSNAEINTTDATVSTVVDGKFVQEIPLNGRSFQSLILLTPGIVSPSPQGNYAAGAYVVNGLPSEGANATLDGGSATTGNAPVGYTTYLGGAGIAGMTSNATALGTTQALIGIDALQEVKISTSTYSAEFGRQPGGQMSYQSRSGNNAYHGTAFDYFRNVALDANNWFNDHTVPVTPKPGEHQNDFGGVFGGPLGIPGLYSGKDRSFFFFSYEGLRVKVPGAVGVAYFPSNGTFNTGTYTNPLYKNLRANSPAALHPILNSFPVPNCSTAIDTQCIDNADGMSPALVTPVTIGSLDAIALRLDFQATPSMRIFARYSDSTSFKSQTPLSNTTGYSGMNQTNNSRTRVYLLGVNNTFGLSATNEVRLQWSPTSSIYHVEPTSYGGAQPLNLYSLAGVPATGEQEIALSFPSEGYVYQENSIIGTRQFQPNAVDTFTWQHGKHLFKTGANYVQTRAYLNHNGLSAGPNTYYLFYKAPQVLANTFNDYTNTSHARQDPTFKNLGVFFQDEWRILPRLTLSMGLRWDLSPAPSVSGTPQRTYSGSLDNMASLQLAPVGTPLYATDFKNFAPRLGIAKVIHNQPGQQLVLRVGGGLFFGTGQSFPNVFGNGPGSGYVATYSAAAYPGQTCGAMYPPPNCFAPSYPIPSSQINNYIPSVASGPYALGFVVDREFTPPKAIQWSVALEQAVGPTQSVTLSYVGTDAPQVGHWTYYEPGKFNTVVTSNFYALRNGPGTEYNSLQLQYKRRAVHGLQVLAGFTWSHSIDSNSTNYSNTGSLPLKRGNSDNDVRSNFNAVLVYDLPHNYATQWKRAVLGGWNVDLRMAARTAYPVSIPGVAYLDPVTGQEDFGTLNYNGRVPYVHKAGIPGGRQFDPTVFSVPTAAQDNSGNAPRNFLRGFGYDEADFSVQRRFPLYNEVFLLFRAEAFNIVNQPAFGALNLTCGTAVAGANCNNTLLGQATSTLNNSLSGLSSLYQQGGPRSLQLALKLQF
jgi:hypothetical protein